MTPDELRAVVDGSKFKGSVVVVPTSSWLRILEALETVVEGETCAVSS